jgi:hypothetical protein
MSPDITEAGVRYLAVPVGSPARGTALTRILAIKGSPGWLVAAASLKEWRFTGVTERDGGTVLYGPWAPGRTLASVLDLPPREVLGFLSRLADALALLKERQVPLFSLQTDAVIFCDDGSVLFLPPEIMRELRGLRPFAMNRETFESISNPDLSRENMVSFALAALLYRVGTGAFPFRAETVEDLHEQMRKLDILSPEEAAGVAPEISEMVMAGLGRSQRGHPDLDEWAEKLGAWRRTGAFHQASAGRNATSAREADTHRRTSERRYRRRVFWEKNWRTTLIIAAVVVVVGAGAGSVLKGVLAPRVTRGYTPRMVVEAFYTSMNSLDHMTMGACVIAGAGKAEINEVTNLYVISRVSLGYEGRSNVVSADEWDKAGRPPIAPPRTLYGVTGLSVVEEKPEPAPVFLVSCQKWTPLPGGPDEASSNQPSGPRYEGHAVRDRVFLKKDRGDWVIYRMDRLSVDPLPLK